MEMTLSNKAMQPLTNFAIQFNKNSFGLIPAVALNVPAPIAPNGSTEISLPLNTVGPVMKMDPLTNLQVGLLLSLIWLLLLLFVFVVMFWSAKIRFL